MPRTVTASDATGVGERVRWTHGLLLPVKAVYYEWADKVTGPDGKKVKVEGTGGEVEYEKYLTLPNNKKGQKWIFEVDPRVLKPDLEFTTARSVMVGMDEWTKYTMPSIMDVIGQGDKSLGVFLDRAAAGTWYVEADLPYTRDYVDADGNVKPQNTLHFVRMTQSLDELKAWQLERFPKQELVPTPDQIQTAKIVFNRLCRGDTNEFNTRINSDAELSPYLEAFAKNDYALVR